MTEQDMHSFLGGGCKEGLVQIQVDTEQQESDVILQEKFEDTKGVIRNLKLKDRQYNMAKRKKGQTNNVIPLLQTPSWTFKKRP